MSAKELKCRACGQPMYLLRQDGKVGGPTMPIDAQPRPDGNITIDVEAGTYRVVGKGNGEYVSHFATCPRAKEFRRGH